MAETATTRIVRTTAVLLVAHVGVTPVTAQQRNPPTPAEPSSVLRLPAPVRVQGVPGRATLPEELKLGFALDIADTIRGGNWDVTAIVTELRSGLVTLRTSGATTGHLVYRLPPGLALRLEANQRLAIKRVALGYGAGFGYALTLTSDNHLLLASARLLGDSQLVTSVTAGLDVVQNVSEKRQLSESRYETIYHVPVDLMIDGSPLRLVVGQSIAFTRGGVDYQAMLTHSSETSPAKGREGVAEGSRYVLEYVITAK